MGATLGEQITKLEKELKELRDYRNKLVYDNRGLAYQVAKRLWHWEPYRTWGTFEDLAQEGMIALVRAVDYYDKDRGTKFSTYAWAAIEAHLEHKVNHALVSRPEAYPHIAEHLLPLAAATFHITEFVTTGKGDVQDPEDKRDKKDPRIDQLEALDRALHKLSSEDYSLLNAAYGLDGSEPVSQKDIAKTKELTRQAISIRVRRAIDRLRDRMEEPLDIEYLHGCLKSADFIPHPWDGEDRNIGAFRSREELIGWFCQPPGEVGQSYRDRGFYTRELAHLSRIIQPRVVVEFGTSVGIGTCLLRWLNPTARLVTVDIADETFLPGDQRVPIGCLAKWNRIKCEYVHSNSWEYVDQGVDLCFIDADHSYDAVKKDSYRAWENRAADHPWAIVWHDYNDRHQGLMHAVTEFRKGVGMKLRSRADSDTVWIEGGK